MTGSERRRRIDEICDSALDRPPEQRAAYVAEACGQDTALRREVDALLARVPAANAFLREPVGVIAARVFGRDVEGGAIPTPEPEDAERALVAGRFPAWPFVALSVPIVLRAAMFAIALMTQSWVADANRIIPAWAQISQSLLFASLAFVLLRYGWQDRRAWSLGLFILDAAATLVAPFARTVEPSPAWLTLALHTPTDAFQAAMLWFFADAFPAAARRARLRDIFTIGIVISFTLGCVLSVLELYSWMHANVSIGVVDLVAQSLRRSPTSGRDWFFSLQFGSAIPLVAAMPQKLGELSPDDRRRFTWLALGIVVGFLPLGIHTIAVTLWPTLDDGPVQGLIIVSALTAVPVASAYAALVQRTLDVRLVIRAALQYVLARSFIWVAAAAPFVALVALVAENRERSVTDLASGRLGLTLLVLTAAGSAAAFGRRRLMKAVDSRFYREQIDARGTLLAVANAVQRTGSLDEFRDTVVNAVDMAFHPLSVVSAVAGGDDALHSLDAEVPALKRASALGQLVAASDKPLVLTGPQSAAIVARLGTRDREWLELAGAKLVLPLRGPRDILVGVIALGEKKSELPYTDEDQTLLAAVGTASGFALQRLLTAEQEEREGRSTLVADPPARECVECGQVFGTDAIACSCGGLLQRAAVPFEFGDRLRFVRRVGHGGAGVVYRAIDLRLRQSRAVKTLPGTDAAVTSRMRREARVMAAAAHQNLAILHGLEVWRGAPMLIMEFLEGGTLADRLKRGPLPLDETFTLGLALSNGLSVLHRTGILHRDIKPSNIGYSTSGAPKLLDFGLAKLIAGTIPHAEDVAESTWSDSVSVGAPGIRGTPSYLSPWVLGGAPPSIEDDLWSLTVTLLEACTGANPFRGATIAATIARVLTDRQRVSDATATLPDHARTFFLDLLVTRTERPQSAREYGRRLQECM